MEQILIILNLMRILTVFGICKVVTRTELQIIEPRHEKINNVISELVRHKPPCAVTELDLEEL